MEETGNNPVGNTIRVSPIAPVKSNSPTQSGVGALQGSEVNKFSRTAAGATPTKDVGILPTPPHVYTPYTGELGAP